MMSLPGILVALLLLWIVNGWQIPPFGQLVYDHDHISKYFEKVFTYDVNGTTRTFPFGTTPGHLKRSICLPLNMNISACEDILLSAFQTWMDMDYFPSYEIQTNSNAASTFCELHPSSNSCIYKPDNRDFDWIHNLFATRGTIVGILRDRYKYTRYLEIGTDQDILFSLMKEFFPVAVGVDPLRGGTHRMTSDDYFRQLRTAALQGGEKVEYDVIFIDGLHEANQVYRDIIHSLRHLAVGGTIVLHDCNPLGTLTAKTAFPRPSNTRYWNGDTWKAAVATRLMRDIEIIIVDVDQGVGVIRRRQNKAKLPEFWVDYLGVSPISMLETEDIRTFRHDLLRLVSIDEFISWLEEE